MDIDFPGSRRRSLTGLAQRVAVATLVVLGIMAVFALLVLLNQVLLLVVGAVLVASVLRAMADPIVRGTGIGDSWAVALAGVLLLAVVGGGFYLLQFQLVSQVSQALSSANDALAKLGAAVNYPDLPAQVGGELRRFGGDGTFLGRLTAWGAATVGAITNVVIIVFGGVYLAIDPDLYRRGLLKLFPTGSREEAAGAIEASGRALKLWLAGQLIAMVVTGTLTGVALWIIGVPSALGLGLIAGLFEFIPLLGPFLGAVPALLTAFATGPTLVLWTAVAFVAIQQVESNVIQPLVTKRYVSIPPALLLFSVVAAEGLFGLPGILLAAPLTVIVFVFVSRAYVRDTLGEPARVPGETQG